MFVDVSLPSPLLQNGATRAPAPCFTMMQLFFLLKVSNGETPLGQLFFALGTLCFAEALQAHVRCQCWYLDDGQGNWTPMAPACKPPNLSSSISR